MVFVMMGEDAGVQKQNKTKNKRIIVSWWQVSLLGWKNGAKTKPKVPEEGGGSRRNAFITLKLTICTPEDGRVIWEAGGGFNRGRRQKGREQGGVGAEGDLQVLWWRGGVAQRKHSNGNQQGLDLNFSFVCMVLFCFLFTSESPLAVCRRGGWPCFSPGNYIAYFCVHSRAILLYLWTEREKQEREISLSSETMERIFEEQVSMKKNNIKWQMLRRRSQSDYYKSFSPPDESGTKYWCYVFMWLNNVLYITRCSKLHFTVD